MKSKILWMLVFIMITCVCMPTRTIGQQGGNPVYLRDRQSGYYADVNSDGSLSVTDRSYKDNEWQYTGLITDNAEFTIKAGVVGSYIIVTSCDAMNGHASVGTAITFKDGSGGAAVYQGYGAADGGGWVKGNGLGRVFHVPTISNGLFAICGTTGTSTAINVRGYTTTVDP
jgi:hypothetical protein